MKALMPAARLLNASILALALGASQVFAENSWSFDGPQTSPREGEVLGGGRVAVGPDGEVYYAFNDFQAGSGDVYFRRSTEFGVTWSTQIKLDTDDPGLNDSRLQAILVDGAWIYVIFLDRREGMGGFQSLRLNVSGDRGLTWLQQDRLLCGDRSCGASADISLGATGEIFVATFDRVYASRDHGMSWIAVHEFGPIGGYPRIASDKAGNVYAVKPGQSTSAGYGVGLSIDVSSDGGLSWSDPLEIDTRPVWTLSQRVSSDPWGNVYVSYQALNQDETRHVFVSHSNDAGRTFSPSLQVDDDADLTGNPYSPNLASDCSGNAYVVYTFPVKLVRTNDFGNSWSPAPILIQPSTAFSDRPDLTVDPNGHVFIAYDSWESDERRRIRFDHSPDEGRTWLDEDVIVADSSSFPSLVADGEGHAYVSWGFGGFRVGHADLGLSLTSGPDKTTFLTIPPEGGSVRLTGAARNASGSFIQDLPVVLELLAPDGSSIEVLARKRLNITDGGVRTRSVRRSVAGALPAGLYRFRVATADPLADQAFFCVMKE